MSIRLAATAALVAFSVVCPSATAAEVRYYEKDGVTYCETRQVVKEQVPNTQFEQRSQTVYQEQFKSDKETLVRSYWTPVTQYQVEPVIIGRWNPFAQPYVEYQSVPRTRWEQRYEKIEVPVVRREVVPTTQTVRVPSSGWRTVEKEVVTRAPVASRTPADDTLVPVQRPRVAGKAIGGVSRLETDPPRHGASTAWRGSSDGLNR